MIQAIDLILQLAEKNIRIYVEEGKLKLNDPNKNINEDMLATIKLHKQALIKYLSDVDEKTAEAIPQIPAAQQYSLSSAQRRLWILSKFQGGSTAYNIPGVYVFEGNLNYIALEQSFNTIIERHEILRTIFKEDEENNAWQIIQPIQDASFKIAYQDLRQQTNQQKNIQAFIHADCNDAFDISTGPLLRASLYQLENNKWIFVYVMHHIIGDGWSMNILIQELLTLYHAYTNKQPNTLTPLRIQYKDYAAWQQQQLSNAETQIHKNYWLHQFTETLPILALPTDKPRPSVKTYNGGVVHKTLPAPLIKNIKALSHEQGGTLFMGLLSGVYALLYKYTHQQDIIIGSPIAGRAHADLENQIGFYVNTLALRTQFKATENYKQLLTHVKQVTLNAHEHQLYPFDELVEQLNLQRDMSRNPLFDVMVSMDAASTNAQQQIGDLQITTYKEETNITSKFDLLFNFAETENEVQLSIEYNNDLFNADTILRMANHVEQLLTNAVAQPTIPLQQLNYLNEKEKHQLTTVFNNTSTQQIHSKTVIVLFEEQVQKTPHDVALILETKKITYKALNEHANRLAHYIQTNYTIKPDDVIGIQLERSEWMIISILAVLKSGGAYVPIDTTYPQERVHYIIENSACRVVINEKEVEKFKKEANKYEPHHVSTIHQYDDLAYIIYTSGSTGTPKGCAITHKSFSNYIQWANNYYATQATKVNFGLYTSLAFDLTITSIFCTLTQGGQLFIYPQQQELSAILQHTFSADSGINYIKLTPSHITVLHQLNITSSNIVVAIVGGEEVTPQHVHILKKINPAIQIYNEYGPTEATVGCVVKQLEENASIQIGKPIAQTAIYIIDEDDQLCAIGVIGEICISGDGLARGYLNKPELTKEKFVPNPFKPATKMYKTGDIGRWLADGNIEYIGRKDDQVKIRGYRIELGEIETALQKYPHIDTAVVAVKWNTQNEKELVAYIISKQALNIADIRTHLSKTLPLYMLPNYILQLDSLPLTHNGKIDKQALPNPEALGISSGVEYIAPTNAIEEKLVQIWQEVLSKEKIGIKDNFFALGGHSLKAIRLAGQVYKQFEVKIALQQLFVQQTVQEQAQYIQQAQTTTYTNIPVAAEQADYPLSSSQRRLWILSQFEEGNVAYNIPGVYVFEGNLNKEALQYAFHTLLTRHEILRTGFKQNEAGEARQFVRPAQAIQFNIPYQDLSNTNQKQNLQQSIEASLTEPFNLTTDILLRANLFKIAANKWIFTYIMHHIISDGWSMDVLIEEVLALYNAYTKGETQALTPLRIQYKDYAVWQQQQLKNETFHQHKNYWLQQLEGEIPVLALPADKPRPAIKTYNGGSVHKIIDHTLSHDIKVFAHQQGATLFMSLLAAVNALFYRYTNQEDIIIGSPIAGREHPDLENQIGFYVNSLALRTRFSGKDNYINLLQKVKQVTTDAYQHQAYPFDELVAALQLPRDMSRNYLYDVEVILQTNAIGHAKKQEQVNGLTISGYPNTESLTSRFDMVFNFVEVENELQLNIEYNSDIYAAHTIHQLSNHIEQLLRAVLQNPNEPIHQIDFLNEKDKHQLLVTFNNTTAHYPTHTTIVHLFEEYAQKTPDAIALFYEGQTLTYKELNEKANQLANYLQSEYHIQPNDLVGIMLNRSEKAIVAILGILKAGAAYVPIDPTYPAARKEFIIQDTNIKALITQIDYLFDVSYYTGNIFAIDVQLDTIEASTQPPTTTVQPEYLAYIIYTSGSTGEPKGVMIEHKAITNTIQAQSTILNVEKQSKVLQFASLSFDASVWEIFLAIAHGHTLYIADEDKKKTPALLEQYIADHAIEVATLPPAYLQLLQIDNIKSLQKLLTAGEAAIVKDANSFAQHGTYINGYGPTESSICATIYTINKGEKIEIETVPIGKPIMNTSIYIMDDHHNLMPIGAIGEICISSKGLAKGYLNRTALTQEKFVPNPFEAGKIMYKTGDLGRWLPNGNIEYAGRKDEQVKIRGYRIELGEIESALQKHTAIEAAAVVVKANQAGDKELVAYIVSKQELNTTDIRNYLAQSLPAYLLPAHYVQLQQLPLTPNGKIDKKALPNPEALELSSGVQHVAPTNDIEQHLVDVYEEVLKKQPIGIKDDFFSLGGDSIKSIQVIARLKQRGYSVTIRDMMTYPVIQDLAGKVQINSRQIRQDTVEGIVPLNPVQQYFFEQADVDHHHYNQSVLLESEMSLSEAGLRAVFDKIVMHHDALRMVFQKTNDGWVQENKGEEQRYDLEIIEITDNESLTQHCQRIQSSINLQTGPLLKIALFRYKNQHNKLLIVCHHLVTDGVSWRILLEDLSNLYQQYLSGTPSPLPLKTDAFKYWQQKQAEYATSKTLQQEEPYWNTLSNTRSDILPKDNKEGSNKIGDARTQNFILSEPLTQQLLTACHKPYQTDINDILLSALTIALQQTFNMRYIHINLEGHGREDIGVDIDVSRTIGWFTSIYPVIINTMHSNNLTRHIIEVKETLHRVPNKGIGYSILRYLAKKPYPLNTNIIFNYLGDFGTGAQTKDGKQLFQFSKQDAGKQISDNMQRDHTLDISGMIVDNQLRISIGYSCQQYKNETIEKLTGIYYQQLQQIIQILATENQTHLTPVDLTYKQLTVEQVQQLNQHNNIEDIYPLSPLQQGLYYHWLTTPNSLAYCDQMSYRLKGHIDITLLEKSFQQLINRHAVLRTSFTQDIDDILLQIVHKQTHSNFTYINIATEKNFSVETYKQHDKTKGFDLHKGSQMRLSVIDLGQDTYEFIWSFHHILMDGWCVGILIKEFFEIYNNEEQNTIPQLPKVHPYSKYIQWLNTIDQQKSHDYWKNYLLGYDTLTSLATLSTQQQHKHTPNKQISSPHNINHHPHDINSLPHSINDRPHDINSLPHSINNHPHDINSLPHSINDRPHDINSLPHSINDRPHDINSLPHNINHHPHDINSLPHNINDLPQNQTYDPQQETIAINNDTHKAIQTLCVQLGITQNTFIQTVWAILLSKYNNTHDVVFGSVVSGRPAEIEGIEEMIGLFINTIPVRIQIQAEKTITELLKQVQKQSTEGIKHHYTQLAEIQSESELGRNLFDHIMVFENYPIQEMVEQSVGNKKDAKLSILSAEEFDQTGYDLTVLVMPEDNLSIKLKYNGNIYEKAFINRLQNHLTQIIEQVLKNPTHATHQINYISASEQHELLVTFNNTAANYSTNKTLTQLFEQQAAQTPNNIAVIFQEKTYSYSTLNQHANQLAHYLQTKYNIQPNDLIGIQLEKSEWMIISILGTLKSGGAYLPIDPSYPQERINYIIEDSKCKLVINQKEIEKFKKEANNYTNNNLPNINTPTDIAYVIYTSGSTGQPKGCMLEHRGVINRIDVPTIQL